MGPPESPTGHSENQERRPKRSPRRPRARLCLLKGCEERLHPQQARQRYCVNRKPIRGFAELEFIAKAENIVLTGDTGRGKTGLACGLLLKALENGYRCQFVKAQNLFDEMYASLADRSTRQLLKRLARLDVLLIDELGYLNLKPEQSNIFFKLMQERYRQHSTIITTNLVYDEWPNFLGSRPMVEALLSRLRHYCHTVHIDGPWLRVPQG